MARGSAPPEVDIRISNTSLLCGGCSEVPFSPPVLEAPHDVGAEELEGVVVVMVVVMVVVEPAPEAFTEAETEGPAEMLTGHPVDTAGCWHSPAFKIGVSTFLILLKSFPALSQLP